MKKVIVGLWGLLLGVMLFAAPVFADEMNEIKPVVISYPSQADEYWEDNIGEGFLIGSRITPIYKIEVEERGYLIARWPVPHAFSLHFYANETLTKKLSRWSNSIGYLVDPGTYYVQPSLSTSPADKVAYFYFLPVSSMLEMTVTEKKTDHAEIAVKLLGRDMDVTKMTLLCVDGKLPLEKISRFCPGAGQDIVDGRYSVYKNGYSSVFLWIDNEEWKGAPVCLETEISGITNAFRYAQVEAVAPMEYCTRERKPLPKVTLFGKELKRTKDYTISYENNIDVGKAKIVIQGINLYYGKTTKTFKILPNPTRITFITSPKTKKIQVRWQTYEKQIAGYQIQYSTKKNFKSGNKTKTIRSASTGSCTISKLKANKKYYVRIRTFQKVGAKAWFSTWSAVREIVTK